VTEEEMMMAVGFPRKKRRLQGYPKVTHLLHKDREIRKEEFEDFRKY
jgi:hypothetical protein